MSLPLGADGLAAAYLGHSTTPEAEVERLLGAIDELDPTLEAWQVVYADEARDAARAATTAIRSGHRVGPFHGVPFALKDIVDVEGRITTAGSKAWSQRISPATAEIAKRLLAAGGILLGKTKTVEFALGGWGTNQHMGTPRNPWDATDHRVPGGSSSGSGVAVASGMASCAIGTDTGGSVRLPAGLCGIVGLKTTEGRLPTDGIVPLSHTLDTPGPMARSVADAALMYDVLTGRNSVDIDTDWRNTSGLYRELQRGVRGLRLGAIPDTERAMTEPDVLADYDRALDTLANLGAEISVFTPPLPFDEMKEMTFVIVTAEAYFHHSVLYDDPSAPLDEACRARGLPGKHQTAHDYVAAQQQRAVDTSEFLAAMAPFDAMLTPTTPMTAPTHADVNEDLTPAHFTRAGNYLGLCGLSLPAGLSPQGLPTGLQILGRANAEELVLRIGSAFEAANDPIGAPLISA